MDKYDIQINELQHLKNLKLIWQSDKTANILDRAFIASTNSGFYVAAILGECLNAESISIQKKFEYKNMGVLEFELSGQLIKEYAYPMGLERFCAILDNSELKRIDNGKLVKSNFVLTAFFIEEDEFFYLV